MTRRASARVVRLDVACLRRWPLPALSTRGDKETRGHVLVIGGSREIPGAVLLAATAALRAGAGKVTLATAASVGVAIAVAMPEARVISLRETRAGALRFDDSEALREEFDAVLIGPGMRDEAATTRLVAVALPTIRTAKVILDAYAMSAVVPGRSGGRRRIVHDGDAQSVLVTPHAGELAHLSASDKTALLADPVRAAVSLAAEWRVTLAFKGATTVIAIPSGKAWRHDSGNIGLAVSGSGDTLAGIIAGLAARGASLEQAAAWGVVVHARAGAVAAKQHGELGYLAREVATAIPGVLARLSSSRP